MVRKRVGVRTEELPHSICPVLEEIKGTLNELVPKIENLENKSDSELSESEDEEEGKRPISRK